MLPPSACKLMTFFVGVSKVCFMEAPVGLCENCCPHDDDINIQYQLFTRINPRVHQVIPVGDPSALQATNFNFTNPTVIYLMGFSESTSGLSTTTMRNAYLSSGSYNFIAVDWSRLIAFPWYVSAVRNTRYMGKRLADFVQFLDSAGVPAATLHVVGFSLGAEAAGFAGKDLKARGTMLGRITGLDPAYPGYGLKNNTGHLAKGDAIFVDVLHSNPGLFGFPEPIGNVDFYPNPGQWIQPGCWIDQLIKNKQLGFVSRVRVFDSKGNPHVARMLLDNGSTANYVTQDLCDGCSHNRAWRLYAESVKTPRGFPATLCRDWRSATRRCSFHVDGYMGSRAGPSMRGKMYLETNETPPFAKNGP